jgi:hypothetical protein
VTTARRQELLDHCIQYNYLSKQFSVSFSKSHAATPSFIQEKQIQIACTFDYPSSSATDILSLSHQFLHRAGEDDAGLAMSWQSRDCCKWEGITCNQNGTVVKVSLPLRAWKGTSHGPWKISLACTTSTYPTTGCTVACSWNWCLPEASLFSMSALTSSMETCMGCKKLLVNPYRYLTSQATCLQDSLHPYHGRGWII